MIVRGLILALYFGSACYAQAASITIVSSMPGHPAVVAVEGPFEQNDDEEFGRKVGSLSDAVISFDSSGGDLRAGISIGETIRLKKFTTLVLGKAYCTSACAVAWLGGTKRFVSSGGRIGFHAAYNPKTGQASSSGNAVMGAYLNKVGLSYDAIVYITKTPPNSITWLARGDTIYKEIKLSRPPDDLLKHASRQAERAPSSPRAQTTGQRTMRAKAVPTKTLPPSLVPQRALDRPDDLEPTEPTTTTIATRSVAPESLLIPLPMMYLRAADNPVDAAGLNGANVGHRRRATMKPEPDHAE